MINLLPPAIKKDHKFGRYNRILLGYAVAFFITAILVALIMVGSLRFVAADKQEIQKTISENEELILLLEKETSNLNKVAKRLDTTYKLFQDSISFSELIPSIGSALPEGVILQSLSLTGGSTDPLSLELSAKDQNLAPVVIRNLAESDVFEAADVLTIVPAGSENEYSYSFSVTASFTGSAEAKKKAAAAEKAKAEAAQAQSEGTDTQ